MLSFPSGQWQLARRGPHNCGGGGGLLGHLFSVSSQPAIETLTHSRTHVSTHAHTHTRIFGIKLYPSSRLPLCPCVKNSGSASMLASQLKCLFSALGLHIKSHQVWTPIQALSTKVGGKRSLGCAFFRRVETTARISCCATNNNHQIKALTASQQSRRVNRMKPRLDKPLTLLAESPSQPALPLTQITLIVLRGEAIRSQVGG